MQDSILRLADKVGIVSFDVFDTLLYRPFLRGDDQLLYLELAHHVDGWLKARKQAEKDILAEGITESPCLEAIYERLPQKWQFMYEEEHRFERAILRPNPEMAEVFRRLKAAGKRLIVVSDMYLKKEVIADLLKNCGFEGFEDIFISCDWGKTKRSGSLYTAVAAKLGLAGDKILHIGDNRRTDVDAARKAGWQALYYPNAGETFLKEHRFAKDYWRRRNKEDPSESSLRSYQLGTLVLMEKNGFLPALDIYGKFFCCGIAFLLQAYAAFIRDKLAQTGLGKAVFVARDGYLLQKFFDALYNKDKQTETVYIYAPRLLIKIINLDFSTLAEKKHREEICSILQYYIDKEPEIAALFGTLPCTSENFDDVRVIFENNKSLFEKYAAQYRQLYREYLEAAGLYGSEALCIDTSAAHFTAQRFLSDFFKRLDGCYIYCEDAPLDFFRMSDKPLTCHLLLEMFISSPEQPVAAVVKDNGQFVPVYKNVGEEDFKAGMIASFVPVINKFITEYCRDAINPSVWNGVKFMDIYKYVICHLSYSNIKKLSKIKSCGSVAHNPEDYVNVWNSLHEVKIRRLTIGNFTLYKRVKIDGKKIHFFCGCRVG